MPILHWLNKDQAVTTAKNSAYRLLEEVPELSYGDESNENLLIQGDNLKALIPFYAGKVKLSRALAEAYWSKATTTHMAYKTSKNRGGVQGKRIKSC